MNNVLFVVSGPSGSGKNTLIDHIKANREDVSHSVSATTRSPRPFEEDGIDYYFKSVDEFKALILEEKLIEWDCYRGNYYGTLFSDVDKKILAGENVVFDITVPGAENIKRIYGDAAKAVFILPPSVETLYNRLKARASDDNETISRRMKFAVESEFDKYTRFDYVIINNELDEARKNMLAIYDSLTTGDPEAVKIAEAFKLENFAEQAALKVSRLREEARNFRF